jgi:signal transduction histidine kinase
METLEPIARDRSYAVERGRFLVGASALIILAHAVDLVQARGRNWPALAVRVTWAAMLLAHARLIFRPRSATYLRTRPAAALGSAVIYLVLLAVTGWSRSPLFSFTVVLVIVLPVIAAEFRTWGLVASAALAVGSSFMLVRDGVSLSEQVGWGHACAVAFPVGWLLSSATRRSQDRVALLRTAREEALARLAQSERLAAVGQLASEVAHRVNSPLAAARSNAAFLRAGQVQGDEERAAWDDLFANA